MQIDVSRFPIAEQPFSYEFVNAIMTVWGYVPHGTHDIFAKNLLKWTTERDPSRFGPVFVISPPKWQARGMTAPVWPKAAFFEALTASVAQSGGQSVTIEGIALIAFR
jgi:hypothetical protein